MSQYEVASSDNFEVARQKWNNRISLVESGLNNIDFSEIENEIVLLSGQFSLSDLTGTASGTVLISTDGTITKRKLRDSDILPDFAVSTFSVGSSTALVGSTVTTPSFTATYNDTVDSAVLTDNYGTASATLNSPFTSFSSTGSFVKNTPGQSVTFTLTAISSGYTATKTTNITWYNYRFYGVSASGAATESFIESLTAELSNSKSKTLSVTAGIGQKIYYAYPTRLGTATFTVGGFEGGFNLLDTISVTNSSEYTENYYLYESTNANLGATTVVIT